MGQSSSSSSSMWSEYRCCMINEIKRFSFLKFCFSLMSIFLRRS